MYKITTKSSSKFFIPQNWNKLFLHIFTKNEYILQI
jgi:hypothetical protein